MKRISIILAMIMAFTCATTMNAQKKTNKVSKIAKTEKKDTVSIMTARAEKGDAVAQNILGAWYYSGKFVKQDYKKAAELWAKAAKNNENPEAIGNLAMCYQTGHGVTKDSVKAMGLYLLSIKKGNKDIILQHEKIVKNTGSLFSSRLLSTCYTKGIGASKDMEKAIPYLERIAKAGDLETETDLARYYLNNSQADKAAPLFKDAAKKGSVSALYFYGLLTHTGKGTKQNKEEGVKLIQKAADKGFNAANYQLGKFYYTGDGVVKDYNKAFNYLKKGAVTNKDAKWYLSQCYINGQGTKQDYCLGTQYLADTYRAHDTQTAKALEGNSVYNNYLKGLKKYYVDNDYAGAISVFRALQKKNVAEAYTMEALCLGSNDYANHNSKKALKSLLKADNLGSVAAAFQLYKTYTDGIGTNKDETKGLSYLTKAANGGYGQALCELGDKYMKGDGVIKDQNKAAEYYLKAEAQGQLTNASAKNLIKCYEEKLSALPDLNNAKERIEKLKMTKVADNLTSMLNSIVK